MTQVSPFGYLPSIHRQEVFNKVATHLFSQGEQSLTNGGACAYRGKKFSFKCAAGALLPDNEVNVYNNTGIGWNNLFLSGPENYSPAAANLDLYIGMTDMIINLQTIHDNARNWFSTHSMREALSRTANAFNCNSFILSSLSFSDR